MKRLPPPPPGWTKIRWRPPRYVYPLGDGNALMVVQYSPRKWYYGLGKLGRRRRWVVQGRAYTRDKALMMAENYAKEMGYGAADTRADAVAEGADDGTRSAG